MRKAGFFIGDDADHLGRVILVFQHAHGPVLHHSFALVASLVLRLHPGIDEAGAIGPAVAPSKIAAFTYTKDVAEPV